MFMSGAEYRESLRAYKPRVFVNGERVEWRELRDGDEIVVGRYRLTFLEVAPAGAPAADAPLETTG